MDEYGMTESKIDLKKYEHNSPNEVSLNNRCSSTQQNKIKKFNFM